MGRTLVYPKNEKNTIHRYDNRGTYDLRDIHSIINAAPVVHVSYASSDPEDPFPTVVPMIGTMGSYEHPSADLDEPLECYLHGYVSSGVMKQARAGVDKGVPLTIAATKVDGIVLSLTPNSHSYNYRSAVLFGHGRIVEDPEEKVWAMQLITNSVVAGRWEQTRLPPDRGEMASTSILKVTIVNGSGKVRSGIPHDDPKDTERAEVTQNVWTGVLPMFEMVGDPIPCGSGELQRLPDHVSDHCEEMNRLNREHAIKASKEDK